MSSMSSILNDSDSQCNLDTRSNFFSFRVNVFYIKNIFKQHSSHCDCVCFV